MRWRRASEGSRGRAAIRVLLAGALALGAVGSCELPKPKIPSLGAAPTAPSGAAEIRPAGRGGELAAELRPAGDTDPTALR